MSRRAPLQKLRGSDPVLLEVQVADLLNRPIGQLEPENLCDLFALAEHESPPKSVVSRLNKFVERAKEEMADLPDGASLTDFVNEIGAVAATGVPANLRSHLEFLAGRESREASGIPALLETLSETQPVAFELGAGVTRAQKAEAAPKAAKKARKTGRTPTRRITTNKVIDVEKHSFVCDLVMDRLESSANNELGETVLVAGVRHRAKPEYPTLLPGDVTVALQDLLAKGLVRKVAKRWSSARRR